MTFKKNNVQVVTMSDAEADAWRARRAEDLLQGCSREKVPGGKELIEKALSVK